MPAYTYLSDFTNLKIKLKTAYNCIQTNIYILISNVYHEH